jgi:hypothetical protein
MERSILFPSANMVLQLLQASVMKNVMYSTEIGVFAVNVIEM